MTDDPIRALLNDLDAIGKPSLPWVLRWTRGDSDPVANAWAVSEDGVAMADLLAYVPKAQPLDVAIAMQSSDMLRSLARARAEDGITGRTEWGAAEQLLFTMQLLAAVAMIPPAVMRKASPPTLDELLATHGAGRR